MNLTLMYFELINKKKNKKIATEEQIISLWMVCNPKTDK